MTNIKLIISFKGTNFYGWQKQKNNLTIQETLEKSLSLLFKKEKRINLIGAGRTDRGVHAIAYPANIIINVHDIKLDLLKYKLNSILPKDISILNIEKVPFGFNARYSAKKREYRYYLYLNQNRLHFLDEYVLQYPYNLNFNLLHKSMHLFSGIHDFTTFGNNDNRIHINPIKTIYKFNYQLKNNLMMFRIIGSSFLRGMVRNILGTILTINKLNQNPDIIKELFALKNNKYCGTKLPAKGLFFYRAYY